MGMAEWDPLADPAEGAEGAEVLPKKQLGPSSTWWEGIAPDEAEEDVMGVLAAAFGLDEEPKAEREAAFEPEGAARATALIMPLRADPDGPKAIRSSNWQAGVVPPTARNSLRSSAASSGSRPKTRPKQHDAGVLERLLLEQTAGLYNPTVMAKRRRGVQKSGRVSVVTPTTETRAIFHEGLWNMFQAQKWSDKELVVVESYQSQPSTFFPQVEQKHRELVLVQLRGDLSTGVKRNIGAHLASGAVVANFDDDDIYAPEYVEAMAGHLLRENLVALTLSTWYDFDVRSFSCGFVDPEAAHELDLLHLERCELDTWKNSPEFREIRAEYVERSLYGYGFSFVHRREAALQHPYPNRAFGEDLPFMQRLRDSFGERVGLIRDECGIVLHIMHGGNTADSAVHFRLTPKQMGGLAVCSISPVKELAGVCEQRYMFNEVGSGFQRLGKFRITQPDVHEIKTRQLDRADRLLAWLRRRAARRREAAEEEEEPPPDFVEL